MNLSAIDRHISVDKIKEEMVESVKEKGYIMFLESVKDPFGIQGYGELYEEAQSQLIEDGVLKLNDMLVNIKELIPGSAWDETNVDWPLELTYSLHLSKDSIAETLYDQGISKEWVEKYSDKVLYFPEVLVDVTIYKDGTFSIGKVRY